MAKISGPFVLTPNVELDIPVPASLGGLPIAITIGNESPYLCQVSISNSTYWLAPLTQDTFLVPPNINLVPIVGESLSGTLPAGANSDIYAVWYTSTDKIDAASIQHPVSLTGNAIETGSTVTGNVDIVGPLDGGGNVKVAVQGTVPNKPVGTAVAGITAVNLTVASAEVVAANAARSTLLIYNEGPSAALIAYAAAATLAAYTVSIPSGSYWEMPKPTYTGAVSGITASTTAQLRITETS